MKKSTKRRGGKQQTHPSFPEWGHHSGVNVSGGWWRFRRDKTLTNQDLVQVSPAMTAVSHEMEDI